MSQSVTAAATAQFNPKNPKDRLLSLDVFRGLTIALMILVNNTGNGHPFRCLAHAPWNGWTLADLVFPFFLFIIGVSLVFSHASRLTRGESKAEILRHALRRATIIFALGLFLNAFPKFVLSTWRIPGVLQRIAICYLVAAVLSLYVKPGVRWAIAATLLVGYWILMRFLPVPGIGVPGVDVPLLHPDWNIAAWLDRKLMMGRLYEGTRDPEGILSTLPAIVNSLAGVAVGEWIRKLRENPEKLICRMVTLGSIFLAAAELWSLTFPINKKLWTSSYVLFTVGLAMLGLAACYWLLDVRGKRGSWSKPAVVFGTNAIFAYVFSELLVSVITVYRVPGTRDTIQNWIFGYSFGYLEPDQIAALAYSLTYVAICYFATWILYRKHVFLKI